MRITHYSESLLITHCSQLTHYSLLTLLIAHYSLLTLLTLLTAHYSLLTTHCSLLMLITSLLITHNSLLIIITHHFISHDSLINTEYSLLITTQFFISKLLTAHLLIITHTSHNDSEYRLSIMCNKRIKRDLTRNDLLKRKVS